MISDILETNGIAWPNPQMWRRPQNNPAVPVPTYYPDDGADSHLHSPRRKSYVGRDSRHSGMPMASISDTLTSQAVATAFNQTTFPPSLSAFHKVAPISGSADAFSDAAYEEWFNSIGLHQPSLQQPHHHNAVEPQTMWSSAVTRATSKQLESDSIMPKIPDFLSPILDQAVDANSLSLAGPSLEEEGILEKIHVPTNTPTILPDGSIPTTGLSDMKKLF